jgi:hypothetical protein
LPKAAKSLPSANENRSEEKSRSSTRTGLEQSNSANQGTPLPRHPKIAKIMNITRNRKNSNLAMPADAAAIPPNPSTAAIMAIIKNVTAQPNMFHLLFAMNRIGPLQCASVHLKIHGKPENHLGYAPQGNQRNEIEIITQPPALIILA